MHGSFKHDVVFNDTCGLHGGEKQKLPGHLRGLAAEKSANSPCPGGQRASSVPMVKSSWTVESASSITSPSRAASRSPCSLRMGHLWAACLRAKFSHLLWPLGGTAPQCHAPVPPPANLVRTSAHSSVSTPLPGLDHCKQRALLPIQSLFTAFGCSFHTFSSDDSGRASG